jgi:hypothetical protein
MTHGPGGRVVTAAARAELGRAAWEVVRQLRRHGASPQLHLLALMVAVEVSSGRVRARRTNGRRVDVRFVGRGRRPPSGRFAGRDAELVDLVEHVATMLKGT